MNKDPKHHLDALNQHYVGFRRFEHCSLHFSILFASVPTFCLLHIWKFQHDHSRGLPVSFHHFKLASAHDVAPAILRQRVGHALQVFAHSRRVVNIHIDDKVGRHLYLPPEFNSSQLTCSHSGSANTRRCPANRSPAAFFRRISASTIRGSCRAPATCLSRKGAAAPVCRALAA